MALKLHFASISLGAAVDQQTGSLSVFDLIEEVRTPQLPMQLQSLVIALALEKQSEGPSNGKMFIHFLTPDGKQHAMGSGDLSVAAEQRRMKAVFRFGNFPIHHFGNHRFVLSWVNGQGTKEGEAILDFAVIQATQVAQGMTPSDKPSVSH